MRVRDYCFGGVLISILGLTQGVYAADVAKAPDLPVKAKKPEKDLPFFLLIDDRITFAWMPKGTDAGAFSIRPDGSIASNTAKQVYAFTHFDIWQYGTNFLNALVIKSDHNDPAAPCTNAGQIFDPNTGVSSSANCAGSTEFYGTLRSTFGWNELFDTKQFSVGPLRNVSFEIGADFETQNTYLAPAKRDVVAGLQFAFNLPYKGFINVAPLVYWEFSNHNAFVQCNNGFAGNIAYPAVGATCATDGNQRFDPTWAVEVNYYMPLDFLPESIQYFAISGRAGWYGPKGPENSPIPYSAPFNIQTKTEFLSEPIRLTFDASKAMWGAKYSHFIDVWVAYSYWQNKFGLDHKNDAACNIAPGVSNNTCTESSVYSGITLKF